MSVRQHSLPSRSLKVAFSLPLAQGSYPFRLSEEEKALSADDWAWFFLRLNPLYQHDFALWERRHVTWAEVPTPLRPNHPILPWARLDQKGSDPALGAELSDPLLEPAIANLDSRHFAIRGDALTGPLNALAYEKQTLGKYIELHPDIDLNMVRVREFDAPWDFGIGAWLDPKEYCLPRLPFTPAELASGPASWFYHVNEPVWQVNTWAFWQGEAVYTNLADGQRLMVGHRSVAQTRHHLTATVRRDDQFLEEVQQLKHGEPIPVSSPDDMTATQFQFLVCLDGYVRPQLKMAFDVANKFFEMHNDYHRPSVKRGARAKPVLIEKLPASTGHTTAFMSRASAPAARSRRHWRAVTIDVAGSLIEQRNNIERVLKQEQRDLGDALTFAIRQRPRGEDNDTDNALKRALCVFELHKHTTVGDSTQQPLSPARMNCAFYGDNMAEYYEARGVGIPPDAIRAGNLSTSIDHTERVREALDLGRHMVLGWYEFVASRQFED